MRYEWSLHQSLITYLKYILIELKNNSSSELNIAISIGGNSIFTSTYGVLSEIQAQEQLIWNGYGNYGPLLAVWNWMIHSGYHFDPYTENHWQSNPWLYYNSLGFGYCDDVANSFSYLAQSLGYQSRFVGLNGHVVPEVYVNNHWVVFDPDLKALYTNTMGDLVGVDYIASHPADNYIANVTRSDYYSLLNPAKLSWAYDPFVLSLYSSTLDNFVEPHQVFEDLNPLSNQFSIPVNSTLNFLPHAPIKSMFDTVVPNIGCAKLLVLQASNVCIDLPFAAYSILGQGSVSIDGQQYQIGSAELIALLANSNFYASKIYLTTTAGAEIYYLLNTSRLDVTENWSIDIGNAINVCIGTGGNQNLIGGGGNDLITQTADVVNGAAGLILQGNAGNDRLVLDGSNAYTSHVVVLDGGLGDDVVEVGLGARQYVGSAQVLGGDGNDLIKLGHIEGNTNGLGYVDAGAGDDTIQILPSWGSAIFGNTAFNINGGSGDDRFEINGAVQNLVGGRGPLVDGGSGFDTLAWKGSYNLGVGGAQLGSVQYISGRQLELRVQNLEHLDIAATGTTGLNLTFTAQDVANITAGSNFDQTTLGISGLTGTGHTLFIDLGAGNQIDDTGWNLVGRTEIIGQSFSVYSLGVDLLAINA